MRDVKLNPRSVCPPEPPKDKCLHEEVLALTKQIYQGSILPERAAILICRMIGEHEDKVHESYTRGMFR